MRYPMLLLAPLALACASAFAAENKFDPQLRMQLMNGVPAQAIVEFRGKADPLLLDPGLDYISRRRAWVAMLQATAFAAQNDLRGWLQLHGIEHQAFWVNNTLSVRGDAALLQSISARADVAYVHADTPVFNRLPTPQNDKFPFAHQSIQAIETVEWGVSKIRAPLAWAAGFTGQGVTIAGQDTGISWTHPALKGKYRGWNGTTADHNYNWHDSIHASITGNSNVCLYSTTAPCDDDVGVGHGTHTMGTMVGDDGAGNQVGVAPGARWIGCRNMDDGTGRPSTYTECMQWLLAPTDLNGANADPAQAPDIVSNSWGCPTAAPADGGEGCTPSNILQSAVENLVNGGIFFVVAAGNDGSAGAGGCNTIFDPPSIYDASFVIGSTTSTDTISSFSSRGPVAGLSTNKPDVVAPGSNVRSSIPGGGYASLSGTSMATPHVAGTAALMMSINPALKGHPDQVAAILQKTAVHLSTTTQVCGAVAAATVPNPVQGYGRIDAWAAVIAADTIFADGFGN